VRLIARALGVGVVLAMALACGGTAATPTGTVATGSQYDLSTLSGTWCHKDGWCYTYVGGTITEENSGSSGTWHQEGDLYISQFGEDVPWVAKIETYTATQLVLVPFDDNERIVYSKR
jgi:hypothetical protein